MWKHPLFFLKVLHILRGVKLVKPTHQLVNFIRMYFFAFLKILLTIALLVFLVCQQVTPIHFYPSTDQIKATRRHTLHKRWFSISTPHLVYYVLVRVYYVYHWIYQRLGKRNIYDCCGSCIYFNDRRVYHSCVNWGSAIHIEAIVRADGQVSEGDIEHKDRIVGGHKLLIEGVDPGRGIIGRSPQNLIIDLHIFHWFTFKGDVHEGSWFIMICRSKNGENGSLDDELIIFQLDGVKNKRIFIPIKDNIPRVRHIRDLSPCVIENVQII